MSKPPNKIKNEYVFWCVLSILSTFFILWFSGTNFFAETGSIIVALGLIKGSKKFDFGRSKIAGADNNIRISLRDNANKELVKWDLSVIVFGTLVNGFSSSIGCAVAFIKQVLF